jgi:hypothetical protein
MDEGIIRKIVIGRDPKNAMAYFIGMKAGQRKVSYIVYDGEMLHAHHKMRYLIYVEDGKAHALWKVIEDMPCIIEYDLDFL